MNEDFFLQQISAINKKYEQIENVTGENFNIFKILKIESSEVRMHSAFLSELLNPDGTHGQKDTFLKEFVQIFETEFSQSDCNNSTVTSEISIGSISEDYMSGGRVDIVITSGSKVIVIENKIYAGDGKNQLQRYKKAYPNADLLYLTLTGSLPSPESIGSLKDNHYKCRSYSIDIINWLKRCREKSVLLPMLRECISQYINLVKYLTHQSHNKIQEMEIQKLILESKEKLGSAERIASELEKLRTTIFSACKKELAECWLKKYETTEIELFEFNDYIFFIKQSTAKEESNKEEYFHFDLFPKKNGSMNFAGLKELEIFRNIAKEFELRSLDSFYANVNYTVWVKSQFDLPNLDFEEYKKLNEDRTEWLRNIMEEAEKFIIHMVDNLILLNNPNIKINDKFSQPISIG